MKRIVSLISIIILCLIIVIRGTSAASPSKQTPSGITLSPASQQVTVQSTEAQHQLEFKITNNELTSQTINLTTADFNTLDESGGLVFVGTNPTQLQKKYGLATWLTIPQSTISVKPRQTVTVRAFILNQSSMSPGGHYGALMLEAVSSSSGDGQNKVSVRPIASSLLFVNKVGGDSHILKLSNVNTRHSLFSLPSTVTLRFRNDGNTHLIPRGVVTITNSRGKLISKGIINENSSIILPESYRRFSIPLNKIVGATHPGKYKIHVDFRFDGYDQFRSYQTSTLLLAPLVFIVAILALIGVVFSGYFVFKNRRLKNYSWRIKKSFQGPYKNK